MQKINLIGKNIDEFDTSWARGKQTNEVDYGPEDVKPAVDKTDLTASIDEYSNIDDEFSTMPKRMSSRRAAFEEIGPDMLDSGHARKSRVKPGYKSEFERRKRNLKNAELDKLDDTNLWKFKKEREDELQKRADAVRAKFQQTLTDEKEKRKNQKTAA